MDTTTPTPERLELSVMRLIPDSGGKIEHVTLSDSEVGQGVSQSFRVFTISISFTSLHFHIHIHLNDFVLMFSS